MDHPDVALVRRGYEAFGNADLDTLRQVIAEDAVHHVPGSSRISGEKKGLDAILAYYGQLGQETEGTFRAELKNLFTDGHGHVMSVHRNTGQRAGKSLDQLGGISFTVRDGKIIDLIECHTDISVSDEFFA